MSNLTDALLVLTATFSIINFIGLAIINGRIGRLEQIAQLNRRV